MGPSELMAARLSGRGTRTSPAGDRTVSTDQESREVTTTIDYRT
jgi:hypothetical protein